jgi:hypothetical protein
VLGKSHPQSFPQLGLPADRHTLVRRACSDLVAEGGPLLRGIDHAEPRSQIAATGLLEGTASPGIGIHDSHHDPPYEPSTAFAECELGGDSRAREREDGGRGRTRDLGSRLAPASTPRALPSLGWETDGTPRPERKRHSAALNDKHEEAVEIALENIAGRLARREPDTRSGLARMSEEWIRGERGSLTARRTAPRERRLNEESASSASPGRRWWGRSWLRSAASSDRPITTTWRSLGRDRAGRLAWLYLRATPDSNPRQRTSEAPGTPYGLARPKVLPSVALSHAILTT